MRASLHSACVLLLAVGLLAACDGDGTPVATVAPTATAGAATPPGTPAAQAGPGDGKIDLGALYHMSRDPIYRSPTGAVPSGTLVTLRLKTARGDLTAASVRVWDSIAAKDQVLPMSLETRSPDADYWSLQLHTPPTLTVLWYRFLAQDGAASGAYQDDKARDGGAGEGIGGQNDNDYSINVYDPKWTLPAWMRDAVIYQIFPDRFYNGDPGNDRPAGEIVYGSPTTRRAWDQLPDQPPQGTDFFGGDLQGVIDKLDYLSSLGVTVLYLNPIFDASSNHGYDTRDYTKIAPWFGTQQTFDTLISEAGKRNIHVILDGVFNHSGSESIYFDRDSQYPTLGAFESKDSPYYSWYHFIKWPKWYETFGTYDNLPKFWEVDPVRDFLFRKPDSIAQRWLKAGAAGWRLDAASDKSDPFWRDFRKAVRNAYPDAVIISENGTSGENAIAGLTGDEWDGTMNYRFMNAALGFIKPDGMVSAEGLDNLLASEREDYGPNGVMASMNLIDSHDKPRALTAVGGDKNRLRLLALLQFSNAGAPTVYYGDEAGLAGETDPDDRRTYPWGHEDASLIAYYQALAKSRHELSALRTGATTRLLADNDKRLYAYARHDDKGTAVVALNAGSAAQTLDLDVHAFLADGTALKDRMASDTSYSVQGGHVQVKLAPISGVLLAP